MPLRITTGTTIFIFASVLYLKFNFANSFLTSINGFDQSRDSWRKLESKGKRKNSLSLFSGENGPCLSDRESIGEREKTAFNEENNTVKEEKQSNLSINSSSLGKLYFNMRTLLQEKLFFDFKPNPEILAIMIIYFVEGALSLAGLAQTFILKDELSLGPAEMSAISGILVFPWTIKPIYGLLSDAFPLFGYRRRSYLVIAGLLGFLCYSLMGCNFPSDIMDSIPNSASSVKVGLVVVPLFLASATIALCDVVVDGIVVERTRDSSDAKAAGGLQSQCWGAAAVGGLISSYFSGSLLEIMEPRDVFTITAFLPLLVAANALLIEEEHVKKCDKEIRTALQTERKAFSGEKRKIIAPLQQQIRDLWCALKDPLVWKPTLFLFLWQSTPTSEGAFFYFVTNDLGKGPEFLGRVGLISSTFSLIGIWCYQSYFTRVAIKDILFWTSIVSVILGLFDLVLITHFNRTVGIPDGVFIFGDDAASSVLGQIAFLPTLVLAAKICPPGVEAVLFATLMSLFNLASLVGTEIGAVLTKLLHVTETDFENMCVLSLTCNISSLYPIFFLSWLDEVDTDS